MAAGVLLGGGSSRAVRQLVALQDVLLDAVLGDDQGPDHAAGGAVTGHRVRNALPDELEAFRLRHVRPVVRVHEAGDVAGAAAVARIVHLVDGAAKRDRVDLAAPLLVVARDDETGHQVVLVVVGDRLEQIGGRVHGGKLAELHRMLPQVVDHEAGQGLRVRRTPAAADVDVVVNLRDLPRGAVRDVLARRRARVRTHDDTTLKAHRHDRRAGLDGLLGLHDVVRAVRAPRLDMALGPGLANLVVVADHVHGWIWGCGIGAAVQDARDRRGRA
mmetsp:Transcript_3218/g.8750  ORF Transcript_3218/g.8750 Transcript_3218/m.8750 type:complete len:273 (-) Transcript_3218:7-825(-)